MNAAVSLDEPMVIDGGASAVELTRLFKLAEEKIKLVENLNQELVIPAVNELRYAGYHMAQFLSKDGEATEQLHKAQNHCKRAIYDAVEAGVAHQLELIKKFQDDFRMLVLTEHISDYANLRKQILQARDLILRSKAADEDRASYYAECSLHLQNLRTGLETLEQYREDLVKVIRQRNRSSWINVSLMAAAVVVGAVGAVFAALAYLSPTPSTSQTASTPPAGAATVAASVSSSAEPAK